MSGRTASLIRGLTALLLAAFLVAPVSSAGVVVDFFDDAASSEAVLSEMALHPAAMVVGGITYIAYQGAGYDPVVAAYDPAENTWAGPYRAGTNPLRLDTHGAPSLFADADGRMHVVYGAHNRPLYHARTVRPGDISEWEELPVIDSIATYPQTFEMVDGRIALFYRTTAYDWVMRISDGTRTSFGAAETILAGSADTWWYVDFRPGADGRIHAAFVWNDYFARFTGARFTRYHVYYMRRDPDGTWRTFAGDQVALPLDRGGADASAKIYDSGEELCNEITVHEDDTGAPCILFLTGQGSGEGAYEWRYLRPSGGGWLMTTITDADHFFDSGAFRPGPDGRVEAFLVTGSSGADGGTLATYRGRGGAIVRWVSSDHGASWSRDTTVTPDESGTVFGDPQYVIGGSGPARLVFTEWTNDETNFFNRMYLWGDTGRVTRDIEPVAERLGGADRYATAVAVSRTSFPEGARTVVIATGRDFPDALAGVPLASALDAPLLLATGSGVPAAVREEIVRLGATRAVLLGGARALGAGVESDLYGRTTITTLERLAGSDRYGTGRAIARKLKSVDPGHEVPDAFVVSGENWPDATSVAPLASILGAPIVLTRHGFLPSDSRTLLDEWGTTRTIVVGGERVVSSAVETTLPDPRRIAGADRYETAARVAAYALERDLLPYRAVIATGEDFPDALTGGGLAARVRGPLVLARRSRVPSATLDYLVDVEDRLLRAYLIGSGAVLGPAVEEAVGGITD